VPSNARPSAARHRPGDAGPGTDPLEEGDGVFDAAAGLLMPAAPGRKRAQPKAAPHRRNAIPDVLEDRMGAMDDFCTVRRQGGGDAGAAVGGWRRPGLPP
jgi:hypothetical protein